MRPIAITCVLLLLIVTTGCHTIESQARDSIVAFHAILTQAISDNLSYCQVDASSTRCETLMKAAAAEDLALDALEAYCGFDPTKAQVGDKCQPVKSKQDALTAALYNMNNFVNDLKTMTGKGN